MASKADKLSKHTKKAVPQVDDVCTGSSLVSVIMGGTFGALGFSGVGTLVQIGVGTLIGLLVYATLFMALIVPSFTFLFGEGNWWPFRPKQCETTAKEALLDKTITE